MSAELAPLADIAVQIVDQGTKFKCLNGNILKIRAPTTKLPLSRGAYISEILPFTRYYLLD